MAAPLAIALISVTSLVVSPVTDAMGSSTTNVWNVATEPSPTGSWYAVDYGDGQWMAIGHSPYIGISTTGATWTEYPVPSGSWQSVAYGDGQWVALSSTDTNPEEIVSTNGKSWTSTNGPAGAWTALTFGDGLFVAVSSTGQIDTSTNAAQWSNVWDHTNYNFTSVTYGNGHFVATDSALGAVAISTNGAQWSRLFPAPSTSAKWGAVVYGDGVFVALDGSSNGYVATSVNASVWALSKISPVVEIAGATFGCGTFVGVGQTAGSSEDFISSTSTTTWITTPVPVDPTSPWTAVGYGDHHFVAVDSSGNIAWSNSSTDCASAVPSSPQQVSGNVSSGRVWTYMHPPSSAGGSPVNSYRVNISNGSFTKECSAPVYFEPNCIINGLANHQVYWLTAQSHSRFGYSVPSDPQFVIPVASANFEAVASASTVSSGSPLVLQVTGVRANSEGIYPNALITVHVGATTTACHPSPFGECLLTISNPPVGSDVIYATYTGYGKSYQSPTSHVTVES